MLLAFKTRDRSKRIVQFKRRTSLKPGIHQLDCNVWLPCPRDQSVYHANESRNLGSPSFFLFSQVVMFKCTYILMLHFSFIALFSAVHHNKPLLDQNQLITNFTTLICSERSCYANTLIQYFIAYQLL